MAYSFSSSSPPSARISSETMSRDIRPRVRPEKQPGEQQQETRQYHVDGCVSEHVGRRLGDRPAVAAAGCGDGRKTARGAWSVSGDVSRRPVMRRARFDSGGRVGMTRLEACPPQNETRGRFRFVARVCFRATARSVGRVASRCVALRGRRDIPGVARIGTGNIHGSSDVETRLQARLHPSTWISRIDRLF